MYIARENTAATWANMVALIAQDGERPQPPRRFLVLLLVGFGMNACMRHPAPPPADATYQIVAAHSRQCLDVEGSDRGDGAQVLQWLCGQQQNQEWRIAARPGGGVDIVARHSGKCLGSDNIDPSDPDAVVQQSCADDGARAGQVWNLSGVTSQGIARAPETRYQIVSAATGKCLDVEGGSKESGARVILYDCGDGAANQEWLLVRAPAS